MNEIKLLLEQGLSHPAIAILTHSLSNKLGINLFEPLLGNNCNLTSQLINQNVFLNDITGRNQNRTDKQNVNACK